MSARLNASVDVPDVDAGVRFYGDVFGWPEVARPLPHMAVLNTGNATLCVHGKPAGSRPTPGEATRRYDRHWTPVHLDVHVDDFEQTLARAVAAGAVVEAEHRRPGLPPVAFCADPFGNGFCVLGPR